LLDRRDAGFDHPERSEGKATAPALEDAFARAHVRTRRIAMSLLALVTGTVGSHGTAITADVWALMTSGAPRDGPSTTFEYTGGERRATSPHTDFEPSAAPSNEKQPRCCAQQRTDLPKKLDRVGDE
jgi:hypothetical protein